MPWVLPMAGVCFCDVGNEDVGGLVELACKAGVKDVRGCDAHVDVFGRGAYVFGDAFDEGHHIMFCALLDLQDLLDVETGFGFDVGEVGFGDEAKLGVSLADGDFDL